MPLSKELKSWKASGEYIEYGPLRHKIFVKQIGDSKATSDRTLLLLHGFPESSFSYHAVVDGLMKLFDRLILFDFVGFGMSDKPVKSFSYSLLEQTDVALTVWSHFGIRGGHLLSHDMGVSVATELVARHEGKLLPAWFSEGLLALTFTNGSMVLALSKLRITQKILISRYGYLMKQLITYGLFSKQIRSAHGNDRLSEEMISLLWESNNLQDGIKKSYLTIKYLKDRKQFEKTRWLPALAQTELPIHLCWGDADAVARVEMAFHLKEKVCRQATVTIMNGLGHFCQLGSPVKWLEHIGNYYRALR